MKQAAGPSRQASGGVSRDEQDRRPEVCAGQLPRKRIKGTKPVNRRKMPRWLIVVGNVIGAIFLAAMVAGVIWGLWVIPWISWHRGG